MSKSKYYSYEPVAMCDTRDMPLDVWLSIKDHGLGYNDKKSKDYVPYVISGSRISAIKGTSPWTSALELAFMLKEIPLSCATPENVEAKQAGHCWEDYVAMMLPHMPGYEGTRVFNDMQMYRHPHYPWMFANLDRRLILPDGTEAIGEVKTTSYRNYDTIKKWKAGIVPEYYEQQCRWYMAIMNIDVAVIICAWGMTVRDMAVIRIERDLDKEKDLISSAEEFLAKLDRCTIPTAAEFSPDKVDFSALLKVYGKCDAVGSVEYFGDDETASEMDELIRLLSEKRTINSTARKASAELESKINTLSAKYLEVLGSKQDLHVSAGTENYLLSWRTIKKVGIDTKRLKAEHPRIFKKYSKDDSYRVLNVEYIPPEETE